MSKDETKYVCMRLHRWSDCELKGCPPGLFGGSGDGSVGFMAVFDDVATLKEAYPYAEILQVTRMRD